MKFRNSEISYTQSKSIFRILNVYIHKVEFIKCTNLPNSFGKFIRFLIHMLSFQKGEYLFDSIRVNNILKALHMVCMRNLSCCDVCTYNSSSCEVESV